MQPYTYWLVARRMPIVARAYPGGQGYPLALCRLAGGGCPPSGSPSPRCELGRAL